MSRAKNGKAISETRKTRPERRRLKRLITEAERNGDLATWRRAKAISGYISGITAITLSERLGVARATINRWMRWFEADGTDGLRTKIPPGGISRLSPEQSEELVKTIEAGPEAAGFTSGVWTGPMIGEWIRRQFGVTYHSQHIPRLLHKLGFSVQRPRRRLARADIERQEIWLKKTFPKIKKKAREVRGVVLFEDEASFWLDGTLHRTWSRVGHQPRVDTYGQRQTAHIYGAISLDKAQFTFQFAEVFNGKTFLSFLKRLVRKYRRKPVFLILDNGPCHNLDKEGKRWLSENQGRIKLHRLPPYSPEFNPIEPVWKTTRKLTTHNRFFETTEERDAALRSTFALFRRKPELIHAHVARFK